MTQTKILTSGVPLVGAGKAAILLHGRGASAESILSLADLFAVDDIAYLAPQAPGYSWYPYSFLAPLDANEPALSQALATVDDLVDTLAKDGIAADRVVLLGFSQGGCLALEYAARNPRRYAGVIGLSSGLIGPENTRRNYPGSLSGTPVFIGCGDRDGHIPLPRVKESTQVLRALGGDVTERIYPGMGHSINDDEIERVREMLKS